jgi:hypothetical protein
MKIKSAYILTIVSLLLAAFSGPVSIVSAKVPAGSDISSSAITSKPFFTTLSTSSTATTPSTSTASYAPQPGDANLIRDKVFMDLANSRLSVSQTYPVQVSATLKGYLPDPCHVLRVAVGAPNATNAISISVYSLVKPGSACIAVLQPFSVTVPVGSFTTGRYTVWVNGMKLGEFSSISISATTSVK